MPSAGGANPSYAPATLLGHLGAIYISITKNILVGHGEDVVQKLEDVELSPDFQEWFGHDVTLETVPRAVIEWYEESAMDLEATFRTAESDERTWTWWPPDQSVGFWLRRMAHETAVHRWDAELAHTRAQLIDRELAQDGIDEALTIYQPRWCRPKSQVPGRGETYRFDQTDGPGTWIVRFQDDGMQARREHAEADVVISGRASDLLLFLWHRIPVDQLDIQGEAQLVGRYFELVPPD